MADSVRVSIATDHIPSIGARKGDYVLDPGTGNLCVFHGVSATLLADTDRLNLRPVEDDSRQ